MPGPKSKSFIHGNTQDLTDDNNGQQTRAWEEAYGKTFKFEANMGSKFVWTTDWKALGHILKNDSTWQKAEGFRFTLARLLGDGLIATEGARHKLQRRVMNPAFGPAQIRGLTPIFVDKAVKLRDIWTSLINPESSSAQVDALSWLNKMTLDVIGEAGFDYKFNALDGEDNELGEAFSSIFRTGQHQSDRFFIILGTLQEAFPIFRMIPELRTSLRMAMKTSARIAAKLVYDRKTAMTGTEEKGAKWHTRDLLSLLVRSNMSTSLAEDQKMCDNDVMSQVPTFLIAGHETTATATTLALLGLTERPDVQQKLRDEVLAIVTDSPTMDQLNALHYLDIVVREALRCFPPSSLTSRVSTKDDVVPLARPYTDRKGVVHHELRVQNGTGILIPITAINRDKDLWGEDADIFNPDRWEDIPEAASSIPGIWGNMLTFFGGPRACIGWRFSVVEMKALLFTLVRAFEFELAVPRQEVLIKRASLVQRPEVKGKGNQLPLNIKPVRCID
ncbi:hypothetical protein VNI00_009717 [Paramarasmius palmivorus]|uniref:Cytochrome P450 n=1 Tax=Paramarasmius palmivorus TaxID=297713 RepID=A0AAW0CMS0_9AGAR